MCTICFPASLARPCGYTDRETDECIPSFQRVSHIDFDDDRPVTKVRATAVTDEDMDW